MIMSPFHEDLERKSVLLEKKIGYIFKNKEYLEAAIVRRSYLNDLGRVREERMPALATIGDSVIGLIVTNKLYDDDKTPEELTDDKKGIVDRQNLTSIFHKMELMDCIILGKTEEINIGFETSDAPGEILERIIGAVFKDGDDEIEQYRICKDIILKSGIMNVPQGK